MKFATTLREFNAEGAEERGVRKGNNDVSARSAKPPRPLR